MNYLSAEDILLLHFMLIEDFGGSHGIRDEGRLLSVVAAPQQEAFGVEQYVGVFQKAAVYTRNIIADHLFVDGNKRSGITAAAIFLSKNGYEMTSTPKSLEDFAVRVAVEHLEVAVIAAWLKAHSNKR